MTTYIIFFLSFVIASFLFQRRSLIVKFFWFVSWLFTLFFIGFRHEVGTDWPNYMIIWNSQDGLFINALLHTEPLYYILMYLVKGMNLSIHWLNLFTTFVAITPVFYFSYQQKNKWVALMSLVAVLFIISYIGYARQAPALGLSFWATFRFLDKKFISSFLLLISASLFHNSAMVLIIVFSGFILFQARSRYKFFVFALLLVILTTYMDQLSGRITNYLNINLLSVGALPRIILVDIALITAIIFRKAILISPFQRNFILYFCLCGLMISLSVFIDSIVADRLILYWLVIQIIVYGNISLITINNNNRVFFLIFISFLNLFVLTVWLGLGTFSPDWIPYKNFLFAQSL